ncbi:MAG TPA: hypothetical protein VNU21_23885 [Usitatibacter sp.]|nr:hypothetical protein [Usitatibacter sp.]
MTTSDRGWAGRAGRLARHVAACALAAACVLASVAHAADPGSVIHNRANAIGHVSGAPVARDSNVVSVIVGAGASATVSAVLAANTTTESQAGATVLVAHTLTNTGTATESFTLSIVDKLNGGWGFSSVALFADANVDGRPDSTTPLAGAVSLPPGAVFHFVARLVVPATLQGPAQNDAWVEAVAANGAHVSPVIDRVQLSVQMPADCGTVAKSISSFTGPTPSAGPIHIALGYDACDKPRSRIAITDVLPAGMRYVPGSGRFSLAPQVPLTDAIVGNDRQATVGPTEIAYDFGATTPGAVTATVFNLPAHAAGSVSFDVEIVPGLENGAVVANTARYTFYDVGNRYAFEGRTNTVTYTVNGRIDFDLTGDRLPTAIPGTTVSFTNVLTNRGDYADTFEVTLAGSTFPEGTTLALFKADGVTPLADTNGNGAPDTGVVAAHGGTYRIVVKATIPANAAPGSYKVTKTARSTAWPGHSASADDVVDSLAAKCALTLEPDNAAQVGFGQHVTYVHWLTNRGNCDEVVLAKPDYLADSRPGWSSSAYVDDTVGGNGSVPGAVDPTDTPVKPGWTTTIKPGESLRLLVDVRAPSAEAAAAAKAKALAESNVTTLTLTRAQGATLAVHDTTSVKAGDGVPGMQDVVRNFPDDTYGAPTSWAPVGGSLWLRADAPSCNAQPGQVETRTVVVTHANGDREELTAVETGPDTGIFVVPQLPVRGGAVVVGDHVIQGRVNDVLGVEVLGCGRRIETVVTLVDAWSVVFDSRSNEPIEGATVMLALAQDGQCTRTPVKWSTNSAASNPTLTKKDGRFAFPSVGAGDYCLRVDPPNGYRFASQVPWTRLPEGHNLRVTGTTHGGSYGEPFSMAGVGLMVVDLPVDAVAQDGLFAQKAASRAVAEVADFVDYTVKVRNATGHALGQGPVTVTYDLPMGFSYLPGSARRDGVTLAEPVTAGSRLLFTLGRLERDAEVAITYRVRIGPVALQGDGVNRARARYVANGTATQSNEATARVLVTGGVFTDKGFILGKVFLDCNANGEQDAGERGVPGVRLLLEDGTYVLTDGAGKFSFYGISNRTHVLKADRTTLPAGAKLEVVSQRNLGDAGSRMIDLKAGELHRADFAIAGCDAGVVQEATDRADALARKADELGLLASTKLEPDRIPVSDPRALPASGVVSVVPAANGAVTPGANGAVAPAKAVTPAQAGAQSPAVTPAKASAQSPPELEDLVPALDNKLGFINLTDGETLPYAQTTVRVKGTAGATFALNVNGADVSDKKVGKRSVLEDKQVQAWEYIGIDLVAGDNTLTLSQRDSFGNERGKVAIHVKAPGKLARVAIEAPKSAVADGRTAAKIVVRLLDANGLPVTTRTPVTLEASRGAWEAEDLDPMEPGTQVMVENGERVVALAAPVEPGESVVVVTSGTIKAEARLDFLPELRSLVAAGVIEGIVNVRHISSGALQAARAGDGFEQELQRLSRTSANGEREAAARAAFFLKGKIRGDYLLTAAYDSDKDTQERLFRDIQPDEFYPVYGDAAVRGFDAQSTSHLYVRVDHRKSYLLYGDFTTQADTSVRRLSNYNRSLTGAKEHYDDGRVVANVFASRDTTRQVIDEVKANGTSGPFMLSVASGLVNSEKVEILTRDRNRPTLILRSVAQARFYDYEMEPLTGRILFKSPVPSVDADLNPISIRITYEVDQGGEEFWVFGGDAQVRVTDNVDVGATAVDDRNPVAPFKLLGAHAIVRLGEKTVAAVEVARAEHPDRELAGNAERVGIKHDGDSLKAEAFAARTDTGFDNPGAYLSQGRGESGARGSYKLDEATTLKAEALRTEDITAHNRRDGVMVSAEHVFANGVKAEVGVRHAHEDGGPAIPPTIVGEGSVAPNDVTSVRTRLTAPVPFVKAEANVYGEVEVDTQDTDRKVVAVGGNYMLPNHGKVYFRHELISSLTGPYGLNDQQRQNATILGVETEYMKDARLFSEYRLHDALDGGDAEAAIGLRNLWSLGQGLRLGTNVEHVHSLSGKADNENSAVALALEYVGSPLWKGSTRIELRDASSQESLLHTIGVASRMNDDWTFLGRNTYSLQRNKGGATDGAEHVLDRLQAGVAYRDTATDKVNALARIEHREERDDTQVGIELRRSTELFSLHADWKPRRPFVFTGHYAAKWTRDDSNGLSSRYHAQLVSGRATWEFAPRWDVGFALAGLFGEPSGARQYGLGLELGYLMTTNLWVSAGYNVLGFHDDDLATGESTRKGVYVRMRYKFDETTLGMGEEKQ